MSMLGRFGLKAGMPTIREQSAGAFAGEYRISNPFSATRSAIVRPFRMRGVNAPTVLAMWRGRD